MKIHFEKGLQLENAKLICQWSNALGESFRSNGWDLKFLIPWLSNPYKSWKEFFHFAEEEFVGVIQKIRLEDRNLHIGRFFINPQKQGQGLGSQALRKFVSLAFENEDIDTISLNVYEANQRARDLYQKEGFEIVQTIEVPERKYIMRRSR